jgi:hypothetical protein
VVVMYVSKGDSAICVRRRQKVSKDSFDVAGCNVCGEETLTISDKKWSAMQGGDVDIGHVLLLCFKCPSLRTRKSIACEGQILWQRCG